MRRTLSPLRRPFPFRRVRGQEHFRRFHSLSRGKPVFLAEGGKRTAGLPPSSEPIRLVFIDAPWCPPCGEAWSALGSASSTFPPDSVHVIRILFDRERIYGQGGCRDVPPLHPAATPGTRSPLPMRAAHRVTTLAALPGPFRKQFRVDQVPSSCSWTKAARSNALDRTIRPPCATSWRKRSDGGGIYSPGWNVNRVRERLARIPREIMFVSIEDPP